MAHGWQMRACPGDYLLPGIWARLVLFESDLPADRIDAAFFPAKRKAMTEGPGHSDPRTAANAAPPKGSSAFRRYLACRSKINFSLYDAASDPFLQIDSCWPGTYRYLTAPYVGLFDMPTKLQDVQILMVQTHLRFRRLCFAGKESAMRRTYGLPVEEVEAIAAAWRQMDSRKLRIRYFPDVLVLALGWVMEASLLGDRDRLKLVEGYDVMLNVFGISFTQLEFLEPEFAGFLDRWLQIRVIEILERDAYRFSVGYETVKWISSSGRCPAPENLLDAAALQAAIYRGERMNAHILDEDLMRRSLPKAMARSAALTHLSWDRSELLDQPWAEPRRTRSKREAAS